MNVKYLMPQFLVLRFLINFIIYRYEVYATLLNLNELLYQSINVGRDITNSVIIDDDDSFNCNRDCIALAEQRTCYYKFVVEQYHVMGPACLQCPFNRLDCFSPQCITADGVERTVLTVNRMIPSSGIHVCVNDKVKIDVINQMPGRSVTFHWHGLRHSNSPWMDGTPFISQCPILPGQRFQYEFIAEEAGTFLYYSKTSFQLLDGLSGPLIIRDIKNLQSNLYDFDHFSHTVFIQDWMHLMADNKYPSYRTDATFFSRKADSFLINGKGIRKVEKNYFNIRPSMPVSEFIVTKKYKYRFRFIASLGLTCSIKVAVQSHNLKLIAVDGNPVQPVDIDVLFMNGGERFDVVIEANKRSAAYWIYVKGIDMCENISQVAVLRYETKSGSKTPKWINFDKFFKRKNLPTFNDINSGCVNRNINICIEHLLSLSKTPEEIMNPNLENFQKFRFNSQTVQYFSNIYSSNVFPKHHLQKVHVESNVKIAVDSFNNKINVKPPFSFIRELKPIPDNLICPETCENYCECLHLITVPLNNVVEIEFTDDKNTERLAENLLKDINDFGSIQTYHFHGNNMYVIRQGTQTELEIFGPSNNPLKSNVLVKKDTITVAKRGYTVVRFIAANPGYWLLSSFFPYKNYSGMSIIFQIGQSNKFVSFPSNFPRCEDYLPSITTSITDENL